MNCEHCGSSNVNYIYGGKVYREGVLQPRKLVRISCNECQKLTRPVRT